MKVYKLNRDGEEAFGFEVDNAYICPGRIATLLRKVNGVSGIELRKPFSFSSDVHLKFKYHGEPFMVWEPYGDSSRYWIGPEYESESEAVNVDVLIEAFERYEPSVIVGIWGDVISLNLKSLLRRFFGDE